MRLLFYWLFHVALCVVLFGLPLWQYVAALLLANAMYFTGLYRFDE